MITSDEEFSSAGRSDNLLAGALGKTLDRATLQLSLALAGIGAVIATLTLLVA